MAVAGANVGERGGAVASLAGMLPLVGREAELLTVTAMLERAPLVTLIGPGGNGKTRLAAEIAARIGEREVFVAPLGPIADPGRVPLALLDAAGARERSARPPFDLVAERLARGPALLVLDNCEHLLAAVGRAAALLLERCPQLRLLATSRERLGIAGESAWSVPPLSLPETRGGGVGAVVRCDAGRFFVDRATRADRAFALTPANAPAVLQICRALDGMPLALGLAAARVAELSPDEIAAGLADRLTFRAGAAADARHVTLRASLDWSNALLSAPEQALLRRLAVFSGGFTAEAAAAVCAGSAAEATDVPTHLHALVERGLVVTAGGRLALLETVRVYAAERLAEAGEEDAARDRHVDWCRRLAAGADALASTRAGRRRLADETANVHAAIELGLARDPEIGLELAAGFGRYWVVAERYDDGRALCARVLSAAARGDSRRRALLFAAAGVLALSDQDYAAAQTYARDGLAVAERSGDDRALGMSLVTMSAMLIGVDIEQAFATAQRAADLLGRSGDPLSLGLGLVAVAQTATIMDRFDLVRRTYARFMELPAAREDLYLRPLAESAISYAALMGGDVRDALRHSESVVEVHGDPDAMLTAIAHGQRVQALAHLGLAEQALEQGEAALAPPARCISDTASRRLSLRSPSPNWRSAGSDWLATGRCR